jgi:hypothetical protein
MKDSRPIGCLMGCACQIGFFAVGGVLASLASIANSSTLPYSAREVLFLSWGVTQWIALVPLIRSERAVGHSKTVQGMLISGCLGLLLSSACASAMILTTGPGR